MNHVKNNNCEKKKFFKSNLFLVLAISFSVLVIGGSITYAFYQSSINGNINSTIARWNFKVNNLTSNVKLDFGELYPGKTGSVDLVLSAENSDLDVYYELIFPRGTINSKLYWDSNYDRGIGSKGNMSKDEWRVGKYGVIKAGSKETVTLYYNWPYGSSSENYSTGTPSASIKIIGRQYTGTSATLPINMLGLTFGSFSGSCLGDAYSYNTIGTGCGYRVETIDSTHGYFKY